MGIKRITPINILIAAGVTWVLWNGWAEVQEQVDGLYFTLLLLLLLLADLAARIAVRDLKRIWILESVFVLAVVAVAWIVRLWMN